MNPAQQRQLEVIARLGRGADIELRLRQHVEGAHQVLVREPRRQRLDPIALGLGGDLRIVQPRRIELDDQQVARQARELADHQAQVVAGLDGAGRLLEHAGAIFVGHGVDDVDQQIAAHQPEDRRDVVGGQRSVPAKAMT